MLSRAQNRIVRARPLKVQGLARGAIPKTTPKADPWLLLAALVLVGFSLLMVYSTTAVTSEQLFGNPLLVLKRHVAHIALGLISLAIFSRVNPRLFVSLAPYLFGVAVLLLIIVLIPQLGHVAGGARRWVGVAGTRLQPGEFVKLLAVVSTAGYIGWQSGKLVNFWRGVGIPLVCTAVLGGLLLQQPDFGSSVVIFSVVFCMLLVGGSRLLHLGLIGVCGLVGGAGLILSSPYRMARVLAFLDPFSDPAKSGYQLIQSLIAVGSGGPLGVGLGAGKQKLFYLPAAHTDFIYAVVAEELGFVGALAIFGLVVVVAYRGFSIAKRLSADPFLCSLAAGLTLLIFLPALLNIGVVLGLLPTKGMVLPLMSYGGSAMLVNLTIVGMLLALSKVDPYSI